MVRLLPDPAKESRVSALMVQQPPHFSATVRQSEESALMVRLLPATAEESRGSDLEDTLRKTTRPESVYLSTFWTYGLNDEGCYTGYCLYEAGDRGKALRRTALHKSWRLAPSWRRHSPRHQKKTLGSAGSRAVKFQKTSLEFDLAGSVTKQSVPRRRGNKV
jgi:hypothetical protein